MRGFFGLLGLCLLEPALSAGELRVDMIQPEGFIVVCVGNVNMLYLQKMHLSTRSVQPVEPLVSLVCIPSFRYMAIGRWPVTLSPMNHRVVGMGTWQSPKRDDPKTARSPKASQLKGTWEQRFPF